MFKFINNTNFMKKIFTILAILFLQNVKAQTAIDTNLSIKNAVRTVDIQAQYPGGMEKLMEFLSNTIVYPKKAQEKGIEGKVEIEFVICQDGTFCNLVSKNKADSMFIKEAIRVLYKMPQWKPATQDGKKVSMYYTLPITFTLEDEPRKKRWWRK
jgi:periplasmic protein TonB